jgi:hypothetical protein
MSTALNLLVMVVFFYVIIRGSFWLYTHVPRWVYSLIWLAWCLTWFVVDVFSHDQVGMALQALVGSYWFREFWKHKPPRMRDKVKKLVGAKAKAIRDKLVAAMPKPSPVSKPVFAPAGA